VWTGEGGGEGVREGRNFSRNMQIGKGLGREGTFHATCKFFNKQKFS